MPNAPIESLLDAAADRIGARDFAGAAPLVTQALAAAPQDLRGLCIYAIIAAETGQAGVAVQTIERALALAPRHPAVVNNAAAVFSQCGQPARARAMWEQLIAVAPASVEARYNLALLCMRDGNVDQAEAQFRSVARLAPGHRAVYMNLGNLVKDMGRPADAMAVFREGMARHPGSLPDANNFLFGMSFEPAFGPEEISREHRRWGQQFEAAIPWGGPFPNDRTAGRRLRVAYLSPNFCDHVVANFAVPLLSRHDHARVQVYCYSDAPTPDGLTDRIRGYADVWRETRTLPDDELAAVIRQDQIDILVDLTMHMQGSRLGVFARRAAPVQVTWLAYPGSTGLSRMDYRLTDPYLDPPGQADHLYTERSVRLETFWCYDPLCSGPPVQPLPADANGYVTFGCLNNFAKVNTGVLEAWREILTAVPESRLLILPPPGATCARVVQALGVDPARIDCQPRQSREAYLALHNRIDLALDPFPYVGHTTAIDGLWMGVPVVSMYGTTVVSRATLSMLSNLGLQELCAAGKAEYVALAIQLARDLPRLRRLRQELRPRLQRSVLMDAPRFARRMETAYEQMWQDWCGSARAT